jgi:hypothetical protein
MALGYIGGSFSSIWTMQSFVRIASLFVAIGLIGAFLYLLSLALSRATAAGTGKGAASIISAIAAFVAALATFVIAVDWFIVGSIRPTTGIWSLLPHGNILIDGGRDGWVLAILLIVGLFGEKIISSLAVYLGFRLPSYKSGRHYADADTPSKLDVQTSG